MSSEGKNKRVENCIPCTAIHIFKRAVEMATPSTIVKVIKRQYFPNMCTATLEYKPAVKVDNETLILYRAKVKELLSKPLSILTVKTKNDGFDVLFGSEVCDQCSGSLHTVSTSDVRDIRIEQVSRIGDTVVAFSLSVKERPLRGKDNAESVRAWLRAHGWVDEAKTFVKSAPELLQMDLIKFFGETLGGELLRALGGTPAATPSPPNTDVERNNSTIGSRSSSSSSSSSASLRSVGVSFIDPAPADLRSSQASSKSRD